MKKLFILALFVLCINNACVFGMCQDIPLNEIYSIMPLDDMERPGGQDIDPTRFCACIEGNLLFIGAYTEAPAYVEVINQETGEVVSEEYFDGEVELSIDQVGLFTIQIYSNYTAVAGDFVLE